MKTKEVVKKKVDTPAPAATKPATAAQAPAPAKGGNWFSVGKEGFDRKHRIDEQARLRKEKGVPRFYLKHTPGQHAEGEGADNEARIVFLDSAGFFVYEHNLKVDGKWGNFCTCVKDFTPCEICSQLNDKPVYTCYFTVIDTRKFVRKDGTVSKNRKVLYPAKGSAIEVIESMKKKHGDLRGLVVDVKRMGERDPNCGRDFDVVMKDGRVVRIDPTKKFEGDLSKPYDYMTICAPPTVEELERVGVVSTVAVGSDEDIEPKKNGGSTETSDENMDALLD